MVELTLPDLFVWDYDDSDTSLVPVFYPEVEAWCRENLTRWHLYDKGGHLHENGYSWIFGDVTLVCSEVEAVLFKLRWADQFAGAELD